MRAARISISLEFDRYLPLTTIGMRHARCSSRNPFSLIKHPTQHTTTSRHRHSACCWGAAVLSFPPKVRTCVRLYRIKYRLSHPRRAGVFKGKGEKPSSVRANNPNFGQPLLLQGVVPLLASGPFDNINAHVIFSLPIKPILRECAHARHDEIASRRRREVSGITASLDQGKVFRLSVYADLASEQKYFM